MKGRLCALRPGQLRCLCALLRSLPSWKNGVDAFPVILVHIGNDMHRWHVGHAALDAQPAARAGVLVDDRREHHVLGVVRPFAEIDRDRFVDERARAIAHLAAHAVEGDAALLVDDRGAHADVAAVVEVMQGFGGAYGDAGQVFAHAAGFGAHVEIRRRAIQAEHVAHRVDRFVRACLNAFAAADAASVEIGRRACARRTDVARVEHVDIGLGGYSASVRPAAKAAKDTAVPRPPFGGCPGQEVSAAEVHNSHLPHGDFPLIIGVAAPSLCSNPLM